MQSNELVDFNNREIAPCEAESCRPKFWKIFLFFQLQKIKRGKEGERIKSSASGSLRRREKRKGPGSKFQIFAKIFPQIDFY